jgi:ABC-type transport system substrate-binding protein
MSFWARYTNARLSRRRALAGAGSAAAAAALLAACGGGSDGESGAAGDSSGLLSEPQDTTSRGKPGGTLKHFTSADLTSMDVAAATSNFTLSGVGHFTYPRLAKFKAVKYPETPSGETEGDLAESFEFSGDRLQLTMKLRRGLKWDPKAPTSGREIDAQDVVFSWGKFSRLHQQRGILSYNAETAPDAPVESMSAPDSHTLVWKLRKPDAATLSLFASSFGLYTMPRESDGGFDPRGEARGYGPYFLEEYVGSSRIVWRKNPDYYVKGRPFIDRIEQPIIPEYAARLAQFRAGNIYTSVVNSSDVIGTKKEIRELLLRQGESYSTGLAAYMRYGYEGDSPFKDQRVRQAVMLLIDRPAYEDLITNKNQFTSEGLPTDVRWQTALPAGYEESWLNAQDPKEFGSEAKYFKLDIAEAKKLLAAAGFPNGLSTQFYYTTYANYGADYRNYAQVFPDLLAAGGIKVTVNPIEYTQFQPKLSHAYVAGKTGDGLNGIIQYITGGSAAPTAALFAYGTSHPAGRVFVGMTPDNGRTNASKGDPEITSLIERWSAEFDTKKQIQMAHEYQRLMAVKAYAAPMGVDNPGFTLSWPVIGNLGVYRSKSGGAAVVETDINRWIDDSQPPLKRA